MVQVGGSGDGRRLINFTRRHAPCFSIMWLLVWVSICLLVHLFRPPIEGDHWQICTSWTVRKRKNCPNATFSSFCAHSLHQKEKLQIISTWPSLRTDVDGGEKMTRLCLFVFHVARRFSYWRKTVVETSSGGKQMRFMCMYVFCSWSARSRSHVENVSLKTDSLGQQQSVQLTG